MKDDMMERRRERAFTAQHYRSFYDGFPAMLRTINVDGTIIDCNELYASYLGYPRDEIIGSSIFDHVLDVSLKDMEESFELWKTTGEVKHKEIWFKKKNGTVFPALLSATKLFDADGKLIGSNTIIEDVSEIYKIKEELVVASDLTKLQVQKLEYTNSKLKDVEARYHSLYDNSPDLIRTINLEGIVLDCNKAYASSLGYTKEEIIGTSLLEQTAERSKDDMASVIDEWKSTGIIKNKETWLKKKDGTIFPTLLSAVNLYDKDGKLIGRTAMLRDMTDTYSARKKIDEDQEQIRRQLEELKKADEQKGEFLSMVSHELKSPLTPIIGFCEAMMDPVTMMGQLTPRQTQSLEKIHKNATRLKKLITDLLDAQKLDMEKMNFEYKEINMQELLGHVHSNLSNAMKEKQIQFSISMSGKTVAEVDRDRLEQVFNNLILNAVDFVPKDGGSIELGCREGKDDIGFYVRDNGIGIPIEKQKNLFKKFYQADTSMTRRQYGGSGLGLAICKGIVEAHGGTIWCESEPGKGTSFYFTIMRRRVLGDE